MPENQIVWEREGFKSLLVRGVKKKKRKKSLWLCQDCLVVCEMRVLLAISDLPVKKITQLQKQNLTGEHNCVGGKSSVYSKGMMQSMLGKRWPELLWQSESLQLVTLCCVYLQTVQLQGVGKARYESRVELMLISIHKWRRYFFLNSGRNGIQSWR